MTIPTAAEIDDAYRRITERGEFAPDAAAVGVTEEEVAADTVKAMLVALLDVMGPLSTGRRESIVKEEFMQENPADPEAIEREKRSTGGLDRPLEELVAEAHATFERLFAQPAGTRRYRIGRDRGGRTYLIPAELLGEWNQYVGGSGDGPYVPAWAVRIEGPDYRLTFEAPRYE